MKFNFKKVASVLASAVMLSSTVGFAAAATFPAPYDSGSAIVYGANGNVQVDMAAAVTIQNAIGKVKGSTNSGSTEGETFKFEKSSTKFHLGDLITSVVSTSIDNDHLPNLLAEGKYVDDDNDEFDYTQKVDVSGAIQLTMFEDNDYKEDEPTVGFMIASGANVLNYTLDFSDEPLVADLATTEIPIMGKTYYVLSNSTSGSELVLTLLDSAETTILAEGESATVDGKEVSISFISTNDVKLNVDGKVTNSLSEGETAKLSDGSYIGVKDISVQDYAGGSKQIEFSIGKGKLTLTSGSEIQMNEEAVSGITATLTNSTAALGTATVTLDKIVIQWNADEDLFVAEDSEITMPGFEAVKLSYGGLTYPAEEVIEVQQGGNLYAVLENFPLKDGEADIAFLYGDVAGAFNGTGKDADSKLVTGTTSITFDADTDDYFVASWANTKDSESYLMRATNFVLDGSDNETDFQYYKDGTWTSAKSGAQAADTFSLGNVELSVTSIDKAGKRVVLANNTAGTNFNTLYSKEGLKVYLPYLAANTSLAPGVINFTNSIVTGHNATSFYLTMVEESEDETVAGGDSINVTIGWDSSSTAEVEVSTYTSSNTDATSTEIGETDVWRDFTYSALATELLFNQPSSGQKSLKLIYHGDEVAADVYISAPDAVIAGTTTAGGLAPIVDDSKISTVSDKNLIVVGGSCINSVAAKLLGSDSPLCGTEFTAKTNAGVGSYIIDTFTSPYNSEKVAMLVAGYEAADTTAAAKRITDDKLSLDVSASPVIYPVIA